jgi:imidazolonepropionase-like amidohydrolase
MRGLAAILAALGLWVGQAAAQTLAVIHARIADDGGDTTLIVRDGKIAEVGAGLAPPNDVRVIDAGGRLVTPGLMNAGTQLGLVEVSSLADTSDQSVQKSQLGPAFDIQYALNANSTLLPRARADGLTRAGVYPGGSGAPPFAGLAATIRLAEGPAILDRPRAMMMVDLGGMAAANVGGSRAAAWILLRDALDESKAWPRVSGGERGQLIRRLDAEALQPVLSGETPLGIVAARESDLRQAVKLADDYHIKVVVFGGAEAWRLADVLAARRIPVVLNPFDSLPNTFDEIGARLDNAALLARAGVEIAFSVPGIEFSHNAGTGVREAAGLAVAHGLPRSEALKALTTNAADIWGIAGHYGSLKPGTDADLVVWDGDPLEPASAPVAVVVRGAPVSLDTRQVDLARRYAPATAKDPWPADYR